ncbi:hypothetical protein MRB53_022167 [Persea americana]|uniref:Uncharacterized protein n=1 Tax=Persea americana TaxID=3435 RepID=A0ACC2L739_PERAE|nr:hypothetical protein MRB53_022167 [Persea americana]
MKKSFCQAKKKAALNRAELLLVGALSGLTASRISFPLEVARKRLMSAHCKVSAHPTRRGVEGSLQG